MSKDLNEIKWVLKQHKKKMDEILQTVNKGFEKSNTKITENHKTKQQIR